MNIVVCVKQVPDTATERKLRSDDKTLDRDAVDGVVNELDEYAVEEALKLKEAHGGEVTVLTMGPGKATETIRKALAMGADKAVHLVDDALHGSDARRTSYAMAQALEEDRVRPGHPRLRVDRRAHRRAGRDARRAPRHAAAHAGQQGRRRRLVDHDPAADRLRLRQGRGARCRPSCRVVEKINEPRYPSFKGIMAAKKKPVETLAIADAGIDADQVGLGAAWSEVVDFAAAPPRAAGTIVKDEGDGGVKVADFLASKKFI